MQALHGERPIWNPPQDLNRLRLRQRFAAQQKLLEQRDAASVAGDNALEGRATSAVATNERRGVRQWPARLSAIRGKITRTNWNMDAHSVQPSSCLLSATIPGNQSERKQA